MLKGCNKEIKSVFTRRQKTTKRLIKLATEPSVNYMLNTSSVNKLNEKS